MDPFRFKNKTILIISPERWGNVFLSKHHYAAELSKNNTVYFLNSSGTRKINQIVSSTKIDEKLIVLDYYNLFFKMGTIPFFISSLTNFFITKQIKKEINTKVDVVWSFEQAKFFNSSPERWVNLYLSKHHYAAELTKNNND
jgi:hypothetical protein